MGRSAVTVSFSFASPSCANSSFDQLKEAAPFLLNAKLSFIHDTGFMNTTITNDQNTLLARIERDIDKLDHVLTHSEEEFHETELYPDAVCEAQSNIATLQEEIDRLQTLLELKENRLKTSLHEATLLRTHLQDAEAQVGSLRLFKETYDAEQADNLSRLERLSLESLKIIENHLNVNEAMSKSFQKVEKVWESIISFQSSSASVKLIQILQKEASLYFQALVIAAEDLAKAEAEVSSLHQKLLYTEGLLEKERKSLRAAREGLEELDRSLGNEESKVDDLFKEASSLKVQLEQKETTVQNLTKEALKNKGLQEMAKKHLAAFHESEKKVHELTAQRTALESQIRSKDLLLEDMKKEAFDKTEALRFAAQIKQDLNLSRHQAVQLTQELERERLQVKDLRQELIENSRAVKAELALRQAEKNLMDRSTELALLRKGIQSRDDVIKLMQEKIDGNIRILQSASNDREVMRKMEARIHSLESKLKEQL